MKKAIVIGACGQDGYFLSNSLEKKGYTVIRVDQNNNISELKYLPHNDFNICNSSHVDRLVKKHKPNEIYHLAAFNQSAQDNYYETLSIFNQSIVVHEVSLFNFLTSIVKYSPFTKLFYAASSHIFGDPPTEVQDENTPINPISLYGITKASGIFLCRKFRKEHGIFAASGILYNHESSRRPINFLSKKIVSGALATHKGSLKKLELGNLDSVVDWGYAPDYVEAMIKILALPKPYDLIIATGKKHSVKDFVSAAYAAIGLDWNMFVTQKKELIKRITKPLIGNPTKIKEVTGWVPSITVEEMVKSLVEEGRLSDQ
ncbi:MAG TPA: hypothetical protein DIW44_08000 [Anaerolineaceae bacterium]|nr:hypothetical protein [Anaerolineaceae bacterium]